MQRYWKPVSDMNGDGLTTISDVSAWFGWLFYYPGDLIILFIKSYPEPALLFEQLATFFETTTPQYGGWISFFISLVAWLVVGCWIVAFVDWLNKPEPENKPETEVDETQ